MISLTEKSGHMPQLDGLRAIAVSAVAWSHWLPAYCGSLPIGAYGVHLFFVLSGFLITGILLDARCGDGGNRAWSLRQFYVRRALRIFPLFYVTIAICSLVNLSPYRETWPWHVSYLSNFYLFFRGDWHGPVSHLWSLAVEEQFYLFWPFLILFVPRKYLLPCIVIAICGAPLFRFGMWAFSGAPRLASILMPSCLDSLGVGAMIAWFARSSVCGRWKFIATAFALGGILGYAALTITGYLDGLKMTFFALTCGSLIWIASRGIPGPMGGLLQSRGVCYIGKISYGIYVYHLLAVHILDFLMYRIPGYRIFDLLKVSPEIYGHPLARGSMLAIITVVMAAASWTLFENPICKLKRHFPMTKARPALTKSLNGRAGPHRLDLAEDMVAPHVRVGAGESLFDNFRVGPVTSLEEHEK